MRDLEAINPKGMRPSRFTSFGAGVSMILALICLPLAYGAAPEVYFYENPIVQLLMAIIVASVLLSVISSIFRWGWKAKFFGFAMICIASVSLIAIVPLLSLLIYGRISGWIKVGIFLVYAGSHMWWVNKFLIIYRNVFSDDALRAILYEEETDAIYYNRRGDKYILDKIYKFSQIPPDRYFVIFVVLGLMLAPIMGVVRNLTGLPFAHVFLVVAMLPVSWMGVGLAFRGFLVCYFYPARLTSTTGKAVYVDLIRKQPLNQRTLRNLIKNENI